MKRLNPIILGRRSPREILLHCVRYLAQAPRKWFALPLLGTLLLLGISYISPSVRPQTRDRTVVRTAAEVVKVDVDLITVDALVLQKKTARIVGDLKQTDFVILEDGTKQQITHFSQDRLPLSVMLLIDRGGCLDPFGTQVHRAAIEALARLKETDEVAVMTYHDTAELLQGFTRDRSLIETALDRVPPHDEWADHCLNKAFAKAADYMVTSGNPVGRRVIIAITGITRNFDCGHGPSGKAAKQAVFESGSVVCGLVPKTPGQRMENGLMVWGTRMVGAFGAPTLDIKQLADETGGEVLEDKPERLDTTFATLIDHLRSRYSLAFVSSNKKRDGSLRKLKIDVIPPVQESKNKLVVKARRGYIAPKE
ncbi:MAG: VWA domain-containing protein [Pyrinomonadaceae bacterium]